MKYSSSRIIWQAYQLWAFLASYFGFVKTKKFTEKAENATPSPHSEKSCFALVGQVTQFIITHTHFWNEKLAVKINENKVFIQNLSK